MVVDCCFRSVRYEFEAWGAGAALIVLNHAWRQVLKPDRVEELKPFIKKDIAAWCTYIRDVSGCTIREEDVVLVYGHTCVPGALQIATEQQKPCQRPMTFAVEVTAPPRMVSTVYEQSGWGESSVDVHMIARATQTRQVFLNSLTRKGVLDQVARLPTMSMPSSKNRHSCAGKRACVIRSNEGGLFSDRG